MICSIKEQETCQVEKRGCEGCYYNQIKLGDIVKHRKDGYTGKVKSIDNVFVHLEDGRHILKCYAEVIKENN